MNTVQTPSPAPLQTTPSPVPEPEKEPSFLEKIDRFINAKR
jgi:hypothetical protein